MNHSHHCEHGHFAVMVALKAGRLALQAAGVAAAFCIMKELHKVHKAIENKEHKHKLL